MHCQGQRQRIHPSTPIPPTSARGPMCCYPQITQGSCSGLCGQWLPGLYAVPALVPLRRGWANPRSLMGFVAWWEESGW